MEITEDNVKTKITKPIFIPSASNVAFFFQAAMSHKYEQGVLW